MKRQFKYRFTLVELLVSVGVFSILLLLMMQFFSGARTLWVANEKRAAVHADATVAMDLMAMLLQSTFYNDMGGTPFAIRPVFSSSNITSVPRVGNEAITSSKIDGWNSMIYFVSNSSMELSKGGSVRYLSFQRKTDTDPNTAVAGVTRNVLELLVFSDSSNSELHFDLCFSPFNHHEDLDTNGNGVVTLDEVRNYLTDKIFNEATPLTLDERKIILRNVTGLKFTPVDYKGKKSTDSEWYNYLPAGIEIELSLMENEQIIKEYQALTDSTKREEFRAQNEYTFRRTVWLGDRTFMIYE